MSIAFTAISSSGTAQQVAGFDANRKWMRIQNYVGSSNPMYVAIGFTATLHTLGEIELSPGGSIIFGLTPPNVISPEITYSESAPPVDIVSVFSAGATGSFVVIH